MRNIFLLITIFTAVALTGCSDGKLKTLKVTGTVTYEGKPLADAMVSFSPKTQGQGNPAYGNTDANGRYKLQTHLGVADGGTTPGEYTVIISKREKNEPLPQSDGPSGTPPPVPPIPKSLIPERYENAATSGFTATVSKSNNVFDFELKAN